ncbi:MAG TPA: hypothetical protein PLM26_12210, partial [Saprospiraceae bacterium]|nr:hypothetical protein [Saprospiraceae bacterium]
MRTEPTISGMNDKTISKPMAAYIHYINLDTNKLNNMKQSTLQSGNLPFISDFFSNKKYFNMLRKYTVTAVMSLIFVLSVSMMNGQTLLVEDMTGYTTGTNLAGQGSWTKGGSGPDATVDNATPLTYTGYNGGGGNYGQMPSPAGTTSRVYKSFTQTTIAANGAVYWSFLVNLSSTTSTGDYFMSLSSTNGGTTYAPRVFAKTSGGGYVLGIGKQDNVGNAVFGSTVLSTGTTYLVVVRYLGVTGTSNDEVHLWVNPSLSSEPSTGSAEATKSSGNDISTVGDVIWHNRSTNNPTGSFDGIRIVYGSTSAIAWTYLNDPAPSINYTWGGTSDNWSDPAKWIPYGVPGANDNVFLNSGTPMLTSNSQIENLTFNGGTLLGDFDLNITGALNWTGGQIGNSGVT